MAIQFEITNRFTGAVQLTRERLQQVVAYDPATGIFTYRIRVARRVRPGDVAGCVNGEGYRTVVIDKVAYKAHRLALFYMTGAWPRDLVDHIDGQRDNNAFANLREASRSQNLANSTHQRRGKVARKGVRLSTNGRWSARIQKNKKSYFLGYHDTEDEAGAAYDAAAVNLFGVFAKGAASWA